MHLLKCPSRMCLCVHNAAMFAYMCDAYSETESSMELKAMPVS